MATLWLSEDRQSSQQPTIWGQQACPQSAWPVVQRLTPHALQLPTSVQAGLSLQRQRLFVRVNRNFALCTAKESLEDADRNREETAQFPWYMRTKVEGLHLQASIASLWTRRIFYGAFHDEIFIMQRNDAEWTFDIRAECNFQLVSLLPHVTLHLLIFGASSTQRILLFVHQNFAIIC